MFDFYRARLVLFPAARQILSSSADLRSAASRTSRSTFIFLSLTMAKYPIKRFLIFSKHKLSKSSCRPCKKDLPLTVAEPGVQRLHSRSELNWAKEQKSDIQAAQFKIYFDKRREIEKKTDRRSYAVFHTCSRYHMRFKVDSEPPPFSDTHLAAFIRIMRHCLNPFFSERHMEEIVWCKFLLRRVDQLHTSNLKELLKAMQGCRGLPGV